MVSELGYRPPRRVPSLLTAFPSFHDAGEMFEKSYLGTIIGMELNGYYAAVLSEGRIQLHMVSNVVMRECSYNRTDGQYRNDRCIYCTYVTLLLCIVPKCIMSVCVCSK